MYQFMILFPTLNCHAWVWCVTFIVSVPYYNLTRQVSTGEKVEVVLSTPNCLSTPNVSSNLCFDMIPLKVLSGQSSPSPNQGYLCDREPLVYNWHFILLFLGSSHQVRLDQQCLPSIEASAGTFLIHKSHYTNYLLKDLNK